MTGKGGLRLKRSRRFKLTLLAMLCILALPAQASGLTGSIRLDCHVQVDGDTLPLSGDTFAIVQIADITVEGQGGVGDLTYQTRPDFTGFACDWSALTGSDRQEKALQLEAYAKEKNYSHMPLAEIAEMLDMSLSSVKMRKKRALKKLKQKMENSI